MTSGAFLKFCRKKAGISQEKLAALLHMNQSDVSKLEQDKKTIDNDTFRDWTKLTNQIAEGIAFMYGGALDPAAIIQALMQVTGAA